MKDRSSVLHPRTCSGIPIPGTFYEVINKMFGKPWVGDTLWCDEKAWVNHSTNYDFAFCCMSMPLSEVLLLCSQSFLNRLQMNLLRVALLGWKQHGCCPSAFLWPFPSGCTTKITDRPCFTSAINQVVHYRLWPCLNLLWVIAESLARVIAAIRIASVRWRSYLPPTHRESSPHRPCVRCAAIRIARLAFIRLTFVPRGTAEWLPRVDCVHWTLAIGDWRFCPSKLKVQYDRHPVNRLEVVFGISLDYCLPTLARKKLFR